MVRFIHTADLQIGKPFNWASGRAQSSLREAREEVVTALGDVAHEQDAHFILIAGDLFDDNTVGDDVVTRTCQRLSEIDVPVYILPGNHDFAGGPSCVYHRDPFLDLKPEHVIVLDEPQPYVVGEQGEESPNDEVVILPAPVERRNEKGDPSDHIDSDVCNEAAPDAISIGLAHGGVEEFGAGEAASRIDPDRAEQADLDYLALGDWHGRKQVGPRTWYSGTPEPDSFKQNDPGNVLMVEIDDPDEPPHVQPVATGKYRWIRKEADLQATEDLDALERWFNDLDDPLNALVRLELSGSLGLDAMSGLEDLKERLENIVLEVRHRGEVQPRATEEELDEIASDGYVGDAVEKLRSISEAGGEDADTADRALQLLYQFQRE
jgi:DNA repair exonuclease SbcCD nuclease subunit